ncbi:MAG: helix-turn-helix domain-containing protein [Candidatus Micrarchaeaceae archaeon]
MDELREKIAGEITLSDSPGSAMKKWREFFGVTQVDLAKQIKVSTSTISDYESNRRLSPGVGVIKRFVDALFSIDGARGGNVSSSLAKFSTKGDSEDKFYNIHDFTSPIKGADFNNIIEGRVVANPLYLDSINLFGYTRLDSLRVILEMSPGDYPKLFGSTTERVFIFEHVSTGRSPMVVVRVAPIKPRVIVIHGVTAIDKLAVKIAQVEKIPLLLTKLDIDKLYERLDRI